MRKGMSPLIAAVLLIAFTVTLGAFLTSWGKPYLQEQTGVVEEQTASGMSCNYGEIKLHCLAFDTTNNTISALIENSGTTDLYGLRFILNKPTEILRCDANTTTSKLKTLYDKKGKVLTDDQANTIYGLEKGDFTFLSANIGNSTCNVGSWSISDITNIVIKTQCPDVAAESSDLTGGIVNSTTECASISLAN